MTETVDRPAGVPSGALDVEYKALPGADSPFTAAVVGDEGTFDALVAVTGVVDEVGDYIVPGAFEKTIKRLTPKGVASHEWKTAISRAEAPIEELYPGDPRLPATTRDGDPWPANAGGVWVKGRYNLDKEAGRDAYADAKFYQGEHSYSIGYHVPEGKSRTLGGIRYIDELEWYEWSDVLHGANRYSQLQSVKTLTQRIRDESPEVKVRTVRNTDYWGLPYGTPIRPGMKPKGKLAREMTARGQKLDTDAGTSDRPDVPDAPDAGAAAVDPELLKRLRGARANMDLVDGLSDEQLEAAATALDGDGKASSTRKAATIRQMLAARQPRRQRSHGDDSLARIVGEDRAPIGSRNPVLAEERRRREAAAAYSAGQNPADPNADLPADDSDIHQRMISGDLPIDQGAAELGRRGKIRQRRTDVETGRVAVADLEPHERALHPDTKREAAAAPDAPAAPDAGSGDAVPADADADTIADALSGVWNDYHVDADQAGNDRNHYADRMRDVLSQQGLDDYAVSDAVDEMLYEDYPNEVADAAQRIAQRVVGERGVTGRDADGNPTFDAPEPSGPTVGAPDATVDERRKIPGRERGMPNYGIEDDDDRRARAQAVIARMRGEDGADPAETAAADAAPDDLADPDAPDPDAPPEDMGDAGPDEVIDTTEQDALDAAADTAAGIVEDDDGEVTISADDADRQDRVEELLDRQLAGRLNLAEQSNEELGGTRRDLVGELNLQMALSRREKRTRDRSQVYEGGQDAPTDGGEGAAPNAPGADADAPAAPDGASGGEPAPVPQRAKREGRPGLAGAAEDLADALESMDADRIERTRMRLESSLNRSRNTGEDHDALRALVDSAAPGGDGAVAEDVRARAESIRAQAREKRNTAARSRRTARRLERERIRSLIGDVDTEMRGRGLNPDDAGGAVPNDDADAPSVPGTGGADPTAPPGDAGPDAGPDAGAAAQDAAAATAAAATGQPTPQPTQPRPTRTGEYGPVALMPDSPDRSEANGPGYRVGQQRQPDGSWQTFVTTPDGASHTIYSETRGEGRREARNLLSRQITETRDGPEPAVPDADLPEAPSTAQVVDERRENLAAAAARPNVNPTTGRVDATKDPTLAATPTMTPRAGEDISATRARWQQRYDASPDGRGVLDPSSYDWSSAMSSPGGGLVALKVDDKNVPGYEVRHAETGRSIGLTGLSQSDARSAMEILERGVGPGGQTVDWSGEPDQVRASVEAAGFDSPADLTMFARAGVAARAVDGGRADSPLVARVAGARRDQATGNLPNAIAGTRIEDNRAALKLLLNDGKKRPTQAGGLVSETRSKEEIADDKATMSVSRAANNVELLGAPDRAVAMLEQRADQLDAAYGPDAAGGHGSLILRSHAQAIRDRYNPAPAGPDAVAQADAGERLGMTDQDGRVRVFRVTSNTEGNRQGSRTLMAVEEGGDGSQVRFGVSPSGAVQPYGMGARDSVHDVAVLDPDEAMPQSGERMRMIADARPDNPIMDEAVDAARTALDARESSGNRQAPAKPTRKRTAAAKPGTTKPSSPQRPPSARVAQTQQLRERAYVGDVPAMAEVARDGGYTSVEDALGPFRRSDNPDVVARFSGDAWKNAKLSPGGWFVVRRDGTVYHAVTGKTAGSVSAANQDIGLRYADMLERIGDPDTGQVADWTGDGSSAIATARKHPDAFLAMNRKAAVDHVAAAGPRATKAAIDAMPNSVAAAGGAATVRPGANLPLTYNLMARAASDLSLGNFGNLERADFPEGAAGDADFKRGQALRKTLDWGTKLGEIRPHDAIVGLRAQADEAGDADIGVMGAPRKKIAKLLNDAADALERANDPEQQTALEKWQNNYSSGRIKIKSGGGVTVERGVASPGSGNTLERQVSSALSRNDVELRAASSNRGVSGTDQLEIAGVSVPGVNDDGRPLRIGGDGGVPNSSVSVNRNDGSITASFRVADPDNLGHDAIVKINIPGDGWDMRGADDPAPGDGGRFAPSPVERDMAAAAPDGGAVMKRINGKDVNVSPKGVARAYERGYPDPNNYSATELEAGRAELQARVDRRSRRGGVIIVEPADQAALRQLDAAIASKRRGNDAPDARPQGAPDTPQGRGEIVHGTDADREWERGQQQRMNDATPAMNLVGDALEADNPQVRTAGKVGAIITSGGSDEDAAAEARRLLSGTPEARANLLDAFAKAADQRASDKRATHRLPRESDDDRPLNDRLRAVAKLLRGDAGAGQQDRPRDADGSPSAQEGRYREPDRGKREATRLSVKYGQQSGIGGQRGADAKLRADLEKYDDDALRDIDTYLTAQRGPNRAAGQQTMVEREVSAALAAREAGGAGGRDVAPDGAGPGGGADDRNTASVTDMTTSPTTTPARGTLKKLGIRNGDRVQYGDRTGTITIRAGHGADFTSDDGGRPEWIGGGATVHDNIRKLDADGNPVAVEAPAAKTVNLNPAQRALLERAAGRDRGIVDFSGVTPSQQAKLRREKLIARGDSGAYEITDAGRAYLDGEAGGGGGRA